jgi:diguanylate cyclase (GGDEF)-like protein
LADPHALFIDKLRHVYRRSGMTFVHGTVVGVMLAGFLLTELPLTPVAAWFVFMLATMGYHSYLGKRLVSEDRRVFASINTRPLTAFAALAGLGWGVSAAFLPFVSPPLQLLQILTLMTIGAASLPRMAALPVIHAGFMAGLFVPVLISLLLVFGLDHWMMAAVLLVVWAGLTDEARKAHVDLIELFSARQALQEEAVRDKLTGIPNRRSFDTALEREWRRAQRLKVPLSLLMIDVDVFKKYNDLYGHQAGDDCLAMVARALVGGPRRAGDLVARYGGEEFVVLLFHTPRDDAAGIAERLRQSVQALGIPHEEAPAGVVSISVGGATCIPDQDGLPETLLRAADTALYQAKADGRNRVAWSAGS